MHAVNQNPIYRKFQGARGWRNLGNELQREQRGSQQRGVNPLDKQPLSLGAQLRVGPKGRNAVMDSRLPPISVGISAGAPLRGSLRDLFWMLGVFEGVGLADHR